jgi:hypothetical protein
MKGAVNYRMGIYKVEIVSRQYNGAIIYRDKGRDLCLIGLKMKTEEKYKV